MVDVDQARAYHASARTATIAARKALADAIEALAEITGVRAEPPQDAAPDLPLRAAAAGRPAGVGRRRAARQPARSLRSSARSTPPGISSTRRAPATCRRSAPTLDVGRPASWPGGDIAAATAATVTTVGVLLRIPLFAGGLTQSQVRQALAQRDVAGADLESLRRRVARETLGSYSDVVAAHRPDRGDPHAVEAATKALASTRVGQQLGTQTMTDLLLAIQTLSSAQSTHSVRRAIATCSASCC